MIPLVAVPVTKPKEFLKGIELVHLTRADLLPMIIDTTNRTPVPPHATHNIVLKAGQGWTVSGRFARDYSVLDPYLTNLKSYGCYTYFFIGKPGKWALLKNIGWSAMQGRFAGMASLHVRGEDLEKNADLVFYRLDDNVLVIRGGYSGPAFVAEGGP